MRSTRQGTCAPPTAGTYRCSRWRANTDVDLAQFLSDFTVQNVLAGAILLGVSSGTLGVFAVLRGQSLLGDALSHATLPGVALGFLLTGTRNLGAITAGALVSGSLAALFVLRSEERRVGKRQAPLGLWLLRTGRER